MIYASFKKLTITMASATMLVVTSGVNANAQENDYPAVARTDYIAACAVSNGQGVGVRDKCVCSLNVIADQLDYDAYVEAETILRMTNVPGAKGMFFQNIPHLKEQVTKLRRAQAEAEIRCF